MKIIPRNKQLRGVLLGCAALSAVMAGPILVDASAQALPPAAACTSGGVCLTSNQANATATSTTTETLTNTAPPITVTETGAPVTVTETGAPVTSTATVTSTVTTGSTATTTVTTTVYPRSFAGADVRPDVTTSSPLTTSTGTTSTGTTSTGTTSTGTTSSAPTGSACGTPGTTSSLGGGEVETCGPSFGHLAVFATQPGLYNSIDNTTSYYVSVGIFAPQFRFGIPDGCYYVPDPSSVAGPGQTVTSTDGILANAVAFGRYSHDVSRPIRVPGFDCAGGIPPTGAGQPGTGQPGLKQ
jgi:hypothetical protein